MTPVHGKLIVCLVEERTEKEHTKTSKITSSKKERNRERERRARCGEKSGFTWGGQGRPLVVVTY